MLRLTRIWNQHILSIVAFNKNVIVLSLELDENWVKTNEMKTQLEHEFFKNRNIWMGILI